MSQPEKPMKTNDDYLKEFIEQLDTASECTKADYAAKLRKLKNDVKFDDTEENIEEFLKSIENPNTRSNKANALIRLRRHFQFPTQKLTDYREDVKAEIRHHRKLQAKSNLENLITYDELLAKLDEMSGKKYFMNYMYCKHGLRNQDINMVFRKRLKGEPTENTLVFNPLAKKPKMTMHIVDYKTAKTYGPKVITVTDKRLFEELKGMNMKNGQYVFATRDNCKPTLNYMNVRACKDSINNYGEGRIAKILVKHLLDNQRHDEVQELSRTRGTALQTLYTHYNTYDN